VNRRRTRGTSAVAHHLAQFVVGLLMVAYVVIFGTLSLRRHENLHTNALDLGYTDQAVWNTLHGRPFRFSTFLDAAFRLDIPIQDFREPGVLLGYHVEPILAPISLLYLVHDGPETLLWLQTIGISLGAIPAYLVARQHFETRSTVGNGRQSHHASSITPRASRFVLYVLPWLPVAFVLIYLLSPSLEAANLSDFHAVALSPALLLAAFYCLETDRPGGFVAFAFLATMCKEEVGLLVAMMGLWAAWSRRRRRLGLAVFVAGAGWSLLCFGVIMPYFSGFENPTFLVRYGQFGDSLAGVLRNVAQQPGLIVDWLRRPDVLRYLRDLWLSSGGLAIFYPLSLVMALPSLAINTFSSYGWMRSEGGHYSSAIVPFLVISGIYGVAWLAERLGKWEIGESGSQEIGHAHKWARPEVAIILLVGAGLGMALVHHYRNGISPLSRRYMLEPVGEHARRAAPFIDQINALPPEVPISVSSNLYPHVGHRERAYLFPTVSNSQFILFDVTSPGSPVPVGDQRQIVRELLDYAQFGVVASDHGLLLLERGLDDYHLSPTLDDVFLADGATPQVPDAADFDGLLRLEGSDWDVRPVVRPELVVEITTYWRAVAPLEEEYRFVFYFWDENNRLVRIQPEEYALHWYPTWLWKPEQLVKVTLPALPVGDLPHVGVAVLRPGVEDLDVRGRVVPITPVSGQALVLRQQDTILELTKP
jgi:uncharacterized membrane protein